MIWPVGGSIKCLGGSYEASVGCAVAAVCESPIYLDRLEDCYALKVLLGNSCIASCCLEVRI